MTHTCGYLPERQARNLVADPEVIDQPIYDRLARLGFRRSGDHVYRPHCPGCDACESLRIPVQRFTPNRSQRRIWQRNQDLHTEVVDCLFRDEHFALFSTYLKARHLGGGMDDTTPESYLDFITSPWSDTRLVEFRHQRQLLAVAVVDYLADGLSAVYTYFDPNQTRRSLGIQAILWQIYESQRLQLPWTYLGYWIANCEKMRYKADFVPHEVFRHGDWQSKPSG